MYSQRRLFRRFHNNLALFILTKGPKLSHIWALFISVTIFLGLFLAGMKEVICGYCPCKFLSLTMELWLEEIICATNFYCNKFLKYMYKELVPIENLGRWIGPRRRNGPLASAPLALARYLNKVQIQSRYNYSKYELHFPTENMWQTLSPVPTLCGLPLLALSPTLWL